MSMPDLDLIDVHIGGVIRAARHSQGMSLEKLGAALGLTYQQIQKYEIGRNRVSAATLYRLAAVLQLDVMDFFPAEGDASSSQSARPNRLKDTGYALGRITDKRVQRHIHGLIDALGTDEK